MKVPFVSFLPLENELDRDLRAAFERVYPGIFKALKMRHLRKRLLSTVIQNIVLGWAMVLTH